MTILEMSKIVSMPEKIPEALILIAPRIHYILDKKPTFYYYTDLYKKKQLENFNDVFTLYKPKYKIILVLIKLKITVKKIYKSQNYLFQV